MNRLGNSTRIRAARPAICGTHDDEELLQKRAGWLFKQFLLLIALQQTGHK
jgi:hypothetical protein